MRPVKEQLEFFENVFNDDSLCFTTLVSLTSEEELKGNRKNQEIVLQISDLVLENIDKIKFNDPGRKKLVKEYFEKVPEIIARYDIEWKLNGKN